MGYQSRDYARRSHAGSWNSNDDAPVCRRILIATIAVYILQIFSARTMMMDDDTVDLPSLPDAVSEDDRELIERLTRTARDTIRPRVSHVQKWLELDTNKVLQGQIWRLVTCAFCHDRFSIWHILVNMLFFWWFGRVLESMYGSREFLLFYLAGAMASSLAYVGLDLATGESIPAIGASGAVMAVTALYAYHFPTHIVRVCMIFPVEMRYLVWLYVIYDLHPVLLELAGDPAYTGVAHAAHLGGLAFGFFYSRRQWRLSRLLDRESFRFKRSEPVAPRDVIPFPRRMSPGSSPTSTLDQILDKIRRSGQDSLTDEELQQLIKESERLRDSRQVDPGE